MVENFKMKGISKSKTTVQVKKKKRFPNTGTQATIYWHSRKIPRRRGIYCSIYRGAAVYTAVYTAAFPGAAVYTGISPERHPTLCDLDFLHEKSI